MTVEKKDTKAPVVIIGTGMAGYGVAREFRKLDRETPLVMLSQDDGCSYAKPMLSNALAAGKLPALLGNASAEKMAADLNARIHCHASVACIDPLGQRLQLGDRWLSYSSLVLAVGAEPVLAPLAGTAASDVLTVNDLGQYAQFHERLSSARRVVILGAGFVGCEFANDLRLSDREVTLVDVAAYPLSRFFPPEAGAFVLEKLCAAGVAWRGDSAVTAVDHHGGGYVVSLSDGSQLETDLVLSAIGLRPRLDLARNAGIEVNRGIVTNTVLQTSAPNVYALGDCAETNGAVQPFVAPLLLAAKALAQTLAGKPTAVGQPPLAVTLKTPAVPAVVVAPGSMAATSWQIERSPDGMTCLLESADAALQGFALLGSATQKRLGLLARMNAEAKAKAQAQA